VDDKEYHWGMYSRLRDEARHYQDQQDRVMTWTVGLSAAVLGLYLSPEKIEISARLAGVALCAVGVYGMLLTAKYEERSSRRSGYAKEHLKDLEKRLMPTRTHGAIRDVVRPSKRSKHPIVKRVPLRWLPLLPSATALCLGVLLLSWQYWGN